MKWKKVEIETTTQAEDLISAMLDELGVEGIEINDAVPLSEEDKQRMFIDILPELPPDDGTATVSFYTDVDTDMDSLLAQVRDGLAEMSAYCNIGTGKIQVSETEDKDWINNWKAFFKPFRVDDTIVIKPTWEVLTEKKDTDLVVEIDPGTAFGTGAHETTKLCILNLKKYLKNGQSVLDVGCGSGILSIVSKFLGSARTLAIDIDPIAVDVSVENAGVNHILAEKCQKDEAGIPVIHHKENVLEVTDGNVLADAKLCDAIGGGYDIVVANILADVIIPLSGVVRPFMKQGALFISSGIINTKEQEVLAALKKNGFEIVEVTRLNDWVSIVAR